MWEWDNVFEGKWDGNFEKDRESNGESDVCAKLMEKKRTEDLMDVGIEGNSD